MMLMRTVKLDPADFTTEIDNPYWPMKPGSRWVYREADADGSRARVDVTVTNRTKRIANGVVARVVRDEVTANGEPVEFYARGVGPVLAIGVSGGGGREELVRYTNPSKPPR